MRVVLPVLGGVAEAGDQPRALLLARDVQVALDDPRAALGELALEAVDGVVAAGPRALVGELADAHREHVLVVRAVEDTELTGARELLPDPPQEVVAQLLRRRAPEARGVHAGRVARPDDMADGAALAGGVEPLQHQQQAPRPPLAPLGAELLLERREPLRVLLLRLPRGGLALLEARGRARVELAQVERARGRAQEGADALGHSRAECPVMVLTREYVDIPVDGRAMRTFVAAPRADGPHPGVVFYTDIFQLTEPSLRWAVRLAGYGYLAAVPEIYHRIEPAGTVLEFDDEGKVRGQGDADATTVADFDADVDAALAWLGERASSLGAAGHCTGGHLAFRAAFRPQVRATACWYATGLHDGKVGKDPDAGSLAGAGEIQGERLPVWGTRDPHTPAAGRAVVRAGLDPLATRLTWREYDAEHAFGRDVGDRYDPEVTDDAFAETVTVFRRAL